VKEEDYTRYYQGLCCLKLGNKDKATEYFKGLIEEGNKRISQGSEVDFFAKFGESEAKNIQISNAYMNIGLGYKGLGDAKSAIMYLQKAVDFSVSNLWANVEMRSK
jgi:tetratricopeptide (TPR) repeat protein